LVYNFSKLTPKIGARNTPNNQNDKYYLHICHK
jgi:hypothetical protein